MLTDMGIMKILKKKKKDFRGEFKGINQLDKESWWQMKIPKIIIKAKRISYKISKSLRMKKL